MTLKNKRTKNARLLFLTFAIFFSLPFTYSQNVISTSGTEFWLGFMENSAGVNTTLVNVSSEFNITGTLSIPTTGYSQSFSLNANETITLSVPVSISVHTNSNVIDSKGILVETSDLATVYAINKLDASTDACLVLDKNSLGTEYRVTSVQGHFNSWEGGLQSSELLIIATEDNTEIEIVPNANTGGGNGANVPIIITLDRGESYQVKCSNYSDLTGSTIKATSNTSDCKPFAVFSGNRSAYVPEGCLNTDHIFDQCIPISKWGKEFLINPFFDIPKYTYKILAHENNTIVNANGSVLTTLNAGQSYSPSYPISGTLAVSSNKNINVTQFMLGNECSGNSNGDPSMTNHHDINNLIKHSAFKTFQDSDYEIHGISIISPTNSVNQIWMDGTLLDSTIFTQFPSNLNFSYASFAIIDGEHYIEAPSGIQGMVYGYGYLTYETYSFLLGGKSLNDLEENDLYLSELVCFSDSVTIGNSIFPLQDIWWELGLQSNDTINNGSNYITVLPDSSQTYILHGNLVNSGCPISFGYKLSPSVDGQIDFNIGTDSLCLNTDYQINASVIPTGNYTYQWNLTSGLSNDTIPNPIINCSTQNQYQLEVKTPEGCIVEIDTTNLLFKENNFIGFETSSGLNSLCLGDTAIVDVLLEEVLINEDFNSAMINPIFELYQNVGFSSYCDSYSSNALVFNGSGTRLLQTSSLDLTNSKFIYFSLMTSGYGSQCDDTEFSDNLALEYSINGGANWQLIQLFDESQFNQHTDIQILIPTNAKTSSTKIRWRQTNNDGANTDLWYLDNVKFTHLIDNGFIINWTPNSDLISFNQGRNAKVFNTSATYFKFSYSDPITGCSYNDSILINVAPTFNVSVTPNFTTCVYSGNQVEVLHDSPETVDISWLPLGVFSNDSISNPTVSVSSDTTLYVSVMSASGCTKHDSINIIVNGVNDFEIDLIGSSNLCNGDTLQSQLNFEATTCITVPHESNGSYSSATVGSLSSGTNGVVESPFPAQLSSKRQIILKTSELLSSGITTASTLNSIGFSFYSGNETYNNFTVKVGCTSQNSFSSGSMYIENLETIINPRTVNIQPGNNIFLFDQDYRWDGISNLVFEICYENQTVPTSCTARYTTSGGASMYSYGSSVCENELGAIGNRRPTIILGHKPLQTNFPTSYLWSPSTNVSDPTISNPTFYPNVTTTYYITAADSVTQCVYEDSITINVATNNGYIDILEGSILEICEGDTLKLNLSTNTTSVNWSNLIDSTSLTPQISPSTNTTYSVIGTSDNICFVSDSIEVIIVNNDPINFVYDTLVLCSGSSLAVETTNNTFDTYIWSNGFLGPSITVNSQGWLYLTASNVCWTDIDSVFINPDSISVNLGMDTAFCQGSVASIGDNLLQGLIYLWSTGEQTQSITPSNTGDYWLEVTNNNGCINRDTINITINSLPIINQVNYSSLCPDDDLLTLIGSPPGGNYTGVGVSNNLFDPSYGTQTLQYLFSDINGCSDSIDQVINVYPEPNVFAGNDLSICLGDSVVLLASGGVGYTWDNSVLDGVFFVPQLTDYYNVVGVDGNGCEGTDSLQITVNNLPNPVIAYNSPELFVVPNSTYQSYQWINCDTDVIVGNTSTFIPTVNSSYAAIVTNFNNCADTSDCYNINFLGINDVSVNNFRIYPNPTTGNVIFDFQGESITINIFNSKGKLILEGQKIEQNQSVNISNYANGIYTIKIESNGQTFYSRITKQ